MSNAVFEIKKAKKSTQYLKSPQSFGLGDKETLESWEITKDEDFYFWNESGRSVAITRVVSGEEMGQNDPFTKILKTLMG